MRASASVAVITAAGTATLAAAAASLSTRRMPRRDPAGRKKSTRQRRCRVLPGGREARKTAYIRQFTPNSTFCAFLSRLRFTPVLVVPEVVPKFM